MYHYLVYFSSLIPTVFPLISVLKVYKLWRIIADNAPFKASRALVCTV